MLEKLEKELEPFRTRIRRCQGKICYDKVTAQTARNKRMRDAHVALRIYPCPICKHWHLTHLRPNQGQYPK